MKQLIFYIINVFLINFIVLSSDFDKKEKVNFYLDVENRRSIRTNITDKNIVFAIYYILPDFIASMDYPVHICLLEDGTLIYNNFSFINIQNKIKIHDSYKYKILKLNKKLFNESILSIKNEIYKAPITKSYRRMSRPYWIIYFRDKDVDKNTFKKTIKLEYSNNEKLFHIIGQNGKIDTSQINKKEITQEFISFQKAWNKCIEISQNLIIQVK